MKRLIVLFVLLLVAVYLGLWMYQDSGYVLITFQNWSIEATLWVFILAILLIFIILSLVIGLLNIIVGIPNFISNWLKNRKTKKARKQTKIGLYAWVEGKWAQAERLLAKAASRSDIPLINYLIAARVAQSQGNFADRDYYLDEAQKILGKQTAVDLVRAQMLLDAKQFDSAVLILTSTYQQSPRSVQVLQLLYKAYLELKDWHRLQILFPNLYKYKVLSKSQLDDLEKNIYIHLLLGKQSSFVALHNFWLCIPRYFRHDNEVLLAYVDSLMHIGNQEVLIEKLLRYALKKSWDDKLIEKYGIINGAKPIRQLAFAEGFLNEHRENVNLLLCLGRLCRKLKLWGKAQNYFEIALRLQENVVLFKELGQLMELLNHKDVALDCYRKALVCGYHL
jgi:HemY protein